MKKIIVVAFLCFLGITQVNAQSIFRPGIRGGANFSHLTQTDNPNEKYSTRTDFYVGAFGALNLSKVYTLQPEINYSRQGAKYEYIDTDNRRYNSEIKVSYLSIGVANKFKFNKFNIHLGPTVDIKVKDAGKKLGATYNEYDNYYYYNDDLTAIDFAFFLGAGFDITKNFAIEARIKKGIIPVNDNGDWDSTNVVFQTGIAYTF